MDWSHVKPKAVKQSLNSGSGQTPVLKWAFVHKVTVRRKKGFLMNPKSFFNIYRTKLLQSRVILRTKTPKTTVLNHVVGRSNDPTSNPIYVNFDSFGRHETGSSSDSTSHTEHINKPEDFSSSKQVFRNTLSSISTTTCNSIQRSLRSFWNVLPPSNEEGNTYAWTIKAYQILSQSTQSVKKGPHSDVPGWLEPSCNCAWCSCVKCVPARPFSNCSTSCNARFLQSCSFFSKVSTEKGPKAGLVFFLIRLNGQSSLLLSRCLASRPWPSSAQQ